MDGLVDVRAFDKRFFTDTSLPHIRKIMFPKRDQINCNAIEKSRRVASHVQVYMHLVPT